MRLRPGLVPSLLLVAAASAAARPALPPDLEPTCPGIPLWSGIVAVDLAGEGPSFRERDRRDERDAGWRVLVLSLRNRVLGPTELDDLREELNRDVLVEGRCFVPIGDEERERVRALLPEGRTRALLLLDPEGEVVNGSFQDPRRAVRRAGELARQDGRVPGREKRARLDGREVSYLDTGSGERAVVLVHGWASDRRVWNEQVAELSRGYRVLAVDLPGHGGSQRPSRAYDMNLFADGIAAVMDDAGVERAVLVGHSNGVPSVRQFWRRYPQRVAGLVLVDGPLKQMMTAEAAAPYLEAFAGEDWKERVAGFVKLMPDSGLSEEAMELILEMALDQPRDAVVGGLQAAVDDGIWSEEPIAVPALVVNAAQPAWSADYRAFVHRLVPGVDYRTWERVSHFLMLERPTDFNAALEEFLPRAKWSREARGVPRAWNL